MTGRGAGYCAGYAVPGHANPWSGGFARRGRWGGRGRGWRHWYYATGMPGWARGGWMPWGAPVHPAVYEPERAMEPPLEDVEALREEVRGLEGVLEQLRARLAELEPDDENSDS